MLQSEKSVCALIFLTGTTVVPLEATKLLKGRLILNSTSGKFQSGSSWKVTAQHSVTFIFCFLILMASWILNATLISGIRRDRRLAHITYYYITSLCVAMILQATLDFPPTVLFETLGEQEYMNTLCIGWIYLDTFLCNVTFLHILSASLDSFLRLRNPRRYIDSTKKVYTCLKVAAPWVVSFLQSTAQFAIGTPYTHLFKEGVCLLNNPNFLILRTTMSFAVPMIASIVLILMSMFRLRAHRNITQDRMVDLVRSYQAALEQGAMCSWDNEFDEPEVDSEHNEHLQLCSLDFNKKLDLAMSTDQETISNNLTRDSTTDTFIRSPSNNQIRMSPIPEVFEHHCPMHGLLTFPIGVPQPAPSNGHEDQELGNSVRRQTPHESNLLHYPLQHQSFSDADGCISCSKPNTELQYICSCQRDHDLSFLQNLSLHHPLLDSHPDPSGRSQQPCQLHSNNGPIPIITSKAGAILTNKMTKVPTPRNHIGVSWARVCKNEKTAIAINMATCIASIGLWSPFILSTFLHGMCRAPDCLMSISYKRISDFKWISYSAAVAFSVLYLLIDRRLRRAASLALICSKPDR